MASLSALTSSTLTDIPTIDVNQVGTDKTNVNNDQQSTSSRTSFYHNITTSYRPHLTSYPKRIMGGKNPSFNADWYRFKWLEYAPDMDACFCFPCHVFLPHSKEKSFTKTGFRNWKGALEKGKGLVEHDVPQGHIHANRMREDSVKRKANHSTIQDIVIQVTNGQMKWLFAVFNGVRYLASNKCRSMPCQYLEVRGLSQTGTCFDAFKNRTRYCWCPSTSTEAYVQRSKCT